MPPSMVIVVPCYNEEAVLPETAKRLLALLDLLISAGQLAMSSHVLFSLMYQHDL